MYVKAIKLDTHEIHHTLNSKMHSHLVQFSLAMHGKPLNSAHVVSKMHHIRTHGRGHPRMVEIVVL